jgi:hypothetical protein
MHWWLAALFFLAVGAGDPALAESPPSPDGLGVSEEELAAKARQGRLTQDELIQKGEELSYFTRLKLYLYAKELEPYFLGVEDAFRYLARSDPEDRAKVESGRRAIYQALTRARTRLLKARREQPETDWRRGLVGLIWLDHEWRGRVYEQGKDEIKNPYDLVALVDCLDAHIRGLEPGHYTECGVNFLENNPQSKYDHEQLSKHGERRGAPGDGAPESRDQRHPKRD